MTHAAENDSLVARLRRAVARLEELHDRPTNDVFERVRLRGKIDGVKLAASYLEEDERIFPSVNNQPDTKEPA